MSGPFKMKGYSYPGSSPAKKVDDNLKNVNISDVSFEGLSNMRSQISKDKDPKDYKKISRAMLNKRNTR